MRLTNRTNRLIYRLWAPIYDEFFDRWFAAPSRPRALEVLDAQPGERLLLVGVGTGADLPRLPAGVHAVGVDICPEMLYRTRTKLPQLDCTVTLVQGDALALPLRPGSFDAVMLSLILSVVPDGGTCFQEALQMLKPSGRMIIFDKFVPDGTEPTWGRRLINCVNNICGADTTRRLGDIVNGCACTVVHDEAILPQGAYRVIKVRPALAGPA